MPKQSNVLSDSDILTKVLAKSRESTSWYDSKLSKERERVLEYYNGQRPKRQNLGSSTYVSTDVYDSVEGMKTQLLEVFAAGDEIATFDPDQDMGIDDCKVATAYARNIIFSQNPGFSIFNDVIHDGLTARVGVVKVWWEECYEYEEETFKGLSLEQVHALAGQDVIDELEANHDPATGLYNGDLIRKIDKSYVKMVPIAPEEFLISPRAVSLELASYTGHRTRKTKAELLEMGLDKAKVAQVNWDDAKGLDLSPEVIARNQPVETAQALDTPIQPELEPVLLYESYVTMVIDKEKGARLYKVVHAGSVLFSHDEVDKAPFKVYVPLPIPHLFYGNSFAARVIPIQNARTVLARAILDHAAMTVQPRWQVVNGGLMNPREMLDNRQGGMVNVRRPDTIAPLPVPNLNPFVFEVMKQLDADNEKSTGITALSQGLNKDAISKQNSRGLVGDLVNLASGRQKIAARNFAYNFFAELMLEVIRLAIANNDKPRMIEVAGKPMMCSPKQWTERTYCTVSMHLGYGEKDLAAQKLQTAYKEMVADPGLQNMFTPQNKYALIRDAMKLGGITNATAYITPPDQVPPIQPDPLKMKELQIKDKLATASLITAQALVAKDQRLAGLDVSKMTLEEAKAHLQAMVADREQTRKDLEVAARIDIANQELEMERNLPDTSKKGIVAPNP